MIAILIATGCFFGLMGPHAWTPQGPQCGATSCITTQAGATLQTESGSNLTTET